MTIYSLLRQELRGHYGVIVVMASLIAISNLVLLVIIHHVVAAPVTDTFHLFTIYRDWFSMILYNYS